MEQECAEDLVFRVPSSNSSSPRSVLAPQVLWWKHVEEEYAEEMGAQADVFGGEDGAKRRAGEPSAAAAAVAVAVPLCWWNKKER